MSTPLLPDALWNLIQPMLPVHTTSPQGWQTSPTRECVSHMGDELKLALPAMH